jgi:broad specificity phosphatase PhoE
MQWLGWQMPVLFITHPDVRMDPGRDVRRWTLSSHGVARMRTFVASEAASAVGEVWASPETKAFEAAGLLAARHDLPVHVHADLGENDRSATGFVPPDEFDKLANAFFAHPDQSVRGWETAVDAQARIRRAVTSLCSERKINGDLAIVAHGGVGALLLADFLGVPISRDLDQPSQGHYWAFDPETLRVIHGWTPIAPP